MPTHQNGTTHVAPREETAPDAPRVLEHRAGQVAAVVNASGDLHLDDGTAFVAIAGENLTLNDGGGALFIAGEDFQLTNGGCAGIVAGRDFALRNGGAGFMFAGRDVMIHNGEGAATVAMQRASVTGHQSSLIAAREVNLHQSSANFVLAGNVKLDDKATVVVEVTPERVAGALVGLLFYLPVKLVQRVLR